MKTLTSFILLLFLLISAPIFTQSYHEVLEDIAEDNNLIGMSVIVMCHGELEDEYYFGKRDLTRDFDVNENTVYRIASISKTVTATAMMKLWEDGEFDLDDDISDEMGILVRNPNYPDTPITYRMILSHQSGLIDGDGYSPFLSDTYSFSTPPDFTELILVGGDYYTSDMWNNIEPGTYFNYSNINFGLIATLIEKISGERFDLYVKENILEPLGITGSFLVDDLMDIDDVAVLYRNSVPQADNYQGDYPSPFNPDDYVIGSNAARFAPQGGLRVSARDLYKFMSMQAGYGSFEDVQVLDSTTVVQMHESQWTYSGSNGNNYYGLFQQWGLGIQSTTNDPGGDVVINGATFYGHPGEAYGLISDMYFEKTDAFGIIFITNGYYGSAGYSFGSNSAFYVPEEEVFEAIDEYHFGVCNGTGLNENFESNNGFIGYDQSRNTLECSEDWIGANVMCFDEIGRTTRSIQINSTTSELYLKSGINLIRVMKNDKYKSLKIFVE